MLKRLDNTFDEAMLPEELVQYICPISRGLMREPVTASSGHTYDKQCITAWFKRSNIDPVTGATLSDLTLNSSFIIERLIKVQLDALIAAAHAIPMAIIATPTP